MIFKLSLCHPDDIGEKLGLQKKTECFMIETPHRNGIARPVVQEAYEGNMSKRTKKSIKENSLRNLALMRTCQAIYNAAAPVLWGQRLTFKTIVQLQHFLLTPNMRLDLVRNVRVWRIDYNIGINYMPGVCGLVADKLKGLEVFDVDMEHMRWEDPVGDLHGLKGFQDDEHLKKAAKNLGFGIYSCMYPWVTKIVREKGIEKLLSILQIVRETRPVRPKETGPIDWDAPIGQYSTPRVFWDFQGHGVLTEDQREFADFTTAEEILRQIDLYNKL